MIFNRISQYVIVLNHAPKLIVFGVLFTVPFGLAFLNAVLNNSRCDSVLGATILILPLLVFILSQPYGVMLTKVTLFDLGMYTIAIYTVDLLGNYENLCANFTAYLCNRFQSYDSLLLSFKS